MPVNIINDNSTIQLDLPKSKASAEIRLFGATVTSWKAAGGSERLFLSSKAALDGTAAIRGGIPIVFPVFGPPSDHVDAPSVVKTLGRHGFARDHEWAISTHTPRIDDQDKVAITLELRTNDKPEIKAIWPFETVLSYTVTLTPNSLHCELKVNYLNGEGDMHFHALLHNYLLVPDSTKTSIQGLRGTFYIDKVLGGEEAQLDTDNFTTNAKPIDRVHVGRHKTTPPGEAPRNVKLVYNASLLQDPLGRMGKGVEVTRSKELKDTVVWNCAEEGNKTIGDLEEDGWKKYVCVEPGSVHGFESLQKGAFWKAEQTLTAW
ncbi:related to Glucose-6-phosphate 1-epimerase [Melanopsichium pennsylvanicum]|uniref:Glucose-6-phosphate 1-epimerase n=2 Tax=Melanopsichium pennsylvanicum TaxID=63383 RepID=A0AAJ5C3Y7_9BASI|nr:galactose mutarotase-like protein [Melanopsichium pennsylvanicum 4]SNX83116.1 related to Glucose-6-phosphate 1-epimerase [Melanopsichium pennsylvanicum]